MKKIINIILIFLLISITLFNFSQVFASQIEALYGDGTDISAIQGDAQNKIKNGINLAIRVVQTVGMFVAVAFLIIIGIKYVAASPSERADLKKHLVAYVAGAVVMFGAVGLLEIIEAFAETATA